MEDEDERVLAGQQRRSEQYRSWLARTRQTVERAKDRPAPYTLPRQIPVGKQSQVDLLAAVMYNKLDDVSKILDNGSVDTNVTDSEGNTALLLAARSGNLEVVELLLNYGFKVNKRNGRNRTALIYAVKGGFCSIVKRLLATEICDVDAQDDEGNTALILAAKRGHNDIVETLLSSTQCDASKQNKYGHTALHDAAKSGRMDLLAMMVFHGANKDIQDKWKSTPLMYATLHGHSNCVALLVQGECDVNLTNMGGRTALHTAAQNGHTNIVGLLLQANADVDVRDSENDTPVLLAARYQHYAIVKMLISKGCDVKATDSMGKNAFHFVCANGYTDLVHELLQPEFGIDPDQPDRNGNTPLTYAVRRNHIPILQTLLHRNCRVQRTCKIGGKEYPIFALALHRGYVDLLRPLAEAGADVGCYLGCVCQGLLSSTVLEDRALLDWLQRIATTPKSLQQLCREGVRRMLSRELEADLERVILPTKLKDFIMMMDKDRE